MAEEMMKSRRCIALPPDYDAGILTV
jgi:hypothetical protein